MNLFCAINSYGSLNNFYAIHSFILKRKKIFFFTTKDFNKKKLIKHRNIKYIFLNKEINLRECSLLFNKFNIKYLYCGTNGNNHFESIFLKTANQKKIVSIGVLDSIMWPIRRFGMSIKKKIVYQYPSYIGVPNKKILNILKKKTKSKIFICKIPSIQYNVFNYYKHNINNKFLIKNILYISTPFEKKTKISINNKQDIKFDEKLFYKIFVKKLNEISIKLKKKINLYIKIHPTEKLNMIDYYIKCSSFFQKNIKVLVIDKKYNFQIYKNMNLVFGISSTMLYETALCKIPTVSLQLSKDFNSNKKNYFTKVKGIYVCRNIDYIEKVIKNNFVLNFKKKINHKFNKFSMKLYKENLKKNFDMFFNNSFN